MAGGGDGGSSEELSHARRLFGFVGDFHGDSIGHHEDQDT